jgi:hypothetical protein
VREIDGEGGGVEGDKGREGREMLTKIFIKAWIDMQKSHKVTNDLNTRSRDMKSKKYPSRARQKEQKEIYRKGIDISEKE